MYRRTVRIFGAFSILGFWEAQVELLVLYGVALNFKDLSSTKVFGVQVFLESVKS